MRIQQRYRPVVLLVLAGLCVSPAASRAQPASPAALATLPIYDGGGDTESFLYVELDRGTVFLADRLKRDPLAIRVERLAPNLFEMIGRPADSPATPGEIFLEPVQQGSGELKSALFVESSTGYVAYFSDVARSGRIGTLTTTLGRPFGNLASPDRNFALLVWRDGAGRSDEAFLYHGTSGRGLRLHGLRELLLEPSVAATSPLPEAGGVAGVALQNSDDSTWAFLVLDGGRGAIHYLEPNRDNLNQVFVRPSELQLFPTFAADPGGGSLAGSRFLPVAVHSDDDTTHVVLIIDLQSGDLAILGNVRGENQTPPFLTKLADNVYARLGAGSTPRPLAAVPRNVSGGRTAGVWILDSLTQGIVYLDNPASPIDARAALVAVERR